MKEKKKIIYDIYKNWKYFTEIWYFSIKLVERIMCEDNSHKVHKVMIPRQYYFYNCL